MDEPMTILVVDDEAVIRNILVKLLHALGHRVLQASNSSEAISQMRTHRPDLVLLDIVMPGLNSMEVVKTASEDADLSSIAIVLVSGLDDLEVVGDYLEAGASGYLPKPFNRALLEMTIQSAAAQKGLQDALAQSRESSQIFCRQLAHDLNNGLTAIMMSAELMMIESNPDRQRASIEEIISATEDLSALIKQRRVEWAENLGSDGAQIR